MRVTVIVGDPVPLCDVKDLEDDKKHYEDALPDISPLILLKIILVTKIMNLFWK